MIRDTAKVTIEY